MTDFSQKDLIVFDLDGTLAESKQPVGAATAGLLGRLLSVKKAAVITGGSFAQIRKQFLPALQKTAGIPFSNLFLLPTSGAALYAFEKNEWEKEYSLDLSPSEKETIRSAFGRAFEEAGEKTPERLWGEQIEDRGAQMTFSALGQQAPIVAKATWDPDQKRRLLIVSFLKPLLPDFSIGIGGMTTIDVTRKGVDKAFGVRELSKYAKVPIERMLYVGDALFPGGNDYEARASGVECHEVSGVADTKRLIKDILEK
jgi:hypothetical protein